MSSAVSPRVLPGFALSLGCTLSYLSLIVLIPLAACAFKASGLSWEAFVRAVWTPQALHAYALTFGASVVAAVVNGFIGFVIAWVLVRYDFPLKRLFDALVDLPFALPTAVAGLVYASLYAEEGWLGRFLVPLGFDETTYNRLEIVLVLIFTGLPFVVRTLQPVLADLDAELEEAAAALGASRWQAFRWVVFPTVVPALLTGFTLALARGLGEYGSVVFVATNIPNETQIAPVLVVARLEANSAGGFQYEEAAALASVLMAASFVLLAAVNLLQRWSKRYEN
jgi:sulfate/thiosulfate transport system permease protein